MTHADRLLRAPISRRAMLTAFGGIGAAAALAACGGSGSGADGGLVVWTSTDFTPSGDSALRKAAAEYGARHDLSIKIQGFAAKDLIDKITTTVSGGGGPDIVLVDVAQVSQLGQAKLVIDLADRIAPIKSQFFAGNLASATVDSKTYAVPYDTSNVALFWNKKMFDKAGIGKPPETWDELRDAAKELTGGGNYGYMLGAKGYGSFLFWPWLWQNGGAITDDALTKATFDSEVGHEAWEFYANLYLKDKVVPPTFLSVTQAWDQYTQPFLTEKVAMMAIGDWGIAPLTKGNPNLDYGLAPLPGNTRKATVLGGNGFAITKAAKKPEDAWSFVRWLTARDQEHVLEDGYQRIPARVDVQGSKFAENDDARAVFVEQAGDALTRPPVPQWGDIEFGLMADAWDSVIQRKKSPADALDSAASQTTAKLGP